MGNIYSDFNMTNKKIDNKFIINLSNVNLSYLIMDWIIIIWNFGFIFYCILNEISLYYPLTIFLTLLILDWHANSNLNKNTKLTASMLFNLIGAFILVDLYPNHIGLSTLIVLYLVVFAFPLIFILWVLFKKLDFSNETLHNMYFMQNKLSTPFSKKEKVISVLAMIFIAIVFFYVLIKSSSFFNSLERHNDFLVNLVLWSFYIILFLILYYLLGKISTISAILLNFNQSIESVEKKKILYLRSFDDDPKTLSSLFEFFVRIEQIIRDSTPRKYSFVGLGNINNKLNISGSIKSHYKMNEWKTEVEKQMKEAVSIIVLMGTSKSLVWEIETIFNNNYDGKTIFLLHSKDRKKCIKVLEKISKEKISSHSVAVYLSKNKSVNFVYKKEGIDKRSINFVVGFLSNELNLYNKNI